MEPETVGHLPDRSKLPNNEVAKLTRMQEQIESILNKNLSRGT